MKTNPSADVSAILRMLRWRLIVRGALDAAAVGALVCLTAWVLIVGVAHIGFGLAPVGEWYWPLVAAAQGAVILAGVICLNALPLERVAALMDARGQTKDRFTTALVLEGCEGKLDALARRECADWLGARDFRSLVPLHPPRLARWLVVPLVALGFLQLDYGLHRATALAEAAQAQESVAETVEQIDQLAQQAKKAGEQTRDEELKKLAEQLQKSADRLRAEAKPEEAPKAALRELSTLEGMLRDLQRQPSPADEMKELAKALASLPGMQEVLDALNRNDLAAAQQAMEKAREEQKNKPDAMAEEQAEKNLQQAMQGLADRRRLSQALQKLAEQMKQQGGGAAQSAMQQLAQMMQQMQQNQQAQNSGGSGRQMTIQEMISALENMKFGDGQGDPQQGGNNQQPGGQPVITQSFGQPNPNGDPSPGGAQSPSGRPGSERDFGTSDTPFGAKTDAQDKGGELAVKGRLGEGEALSMMLPSVGDQSRAARRYKDLYEAAAASAQDSIEQEDIPLGSRFLIKRYFEGIRPKE